MTRAFTLIELLVVIAIIAILTAVILPALSGSKGKARDAQRVSDVSQLQLALELYFDRCGQYPAAVQIGGSSGPYIVNIASSCTTSNGAVTMGAYISQIPTPPSGANQTGYDYATYSPSGNIVSYALQALLESTNPAVNKGLASGPSGTGWSNTSPFSGCSNSGTSKDYCIGPN